MRHFSAATMFLLALALHHHDVDANVYNLKVVTDASPDYSDMDSMIHSICGKWETPQEKLWAVFYWNHIARRQTSPMMLHGVALTDPIRQFNDYGYTMCSTISGINCAIWDAMGFRVKYWDISNHTVAEVEYGGLWHMYDSSLSALYTLCDGRTIAAVEDIGATRGCAASGGQLERGHVAKYHCLTATSANGFLTGSDTGRDLDQEVRCFNPNGLKYRPYYHDWDRGHRYILNLREREVYTRFYHKRGDTPDYYVPNHGKDPDDPRFRIRGNGLWEFTPSLQADSLARSALWTKGLRAASPAGVEPVAAGEPGEAVFKIEGANVITSLAVEALFWRRTPSDLNTVAVSTTNGLTWTEVWRNETTGETPLDLVLVDEVNGAYEVLVRFTLLGRNAPADAALRRVRFRTITMLNSKTQPRLLLGRNTVYVGAGAQTGSIVFWPDLRGEAWTPLAADHENIVSEPDNPGYQGTMHAIRGGREGYVVFRIDAPGDLTRVTYGGRLYNRAPSSHIDFLHSFDNGATWETSYSLTDTAQPWDVIHYVTVPAPPNARSVLLKYSLNSSQAGKGACSIYALRMEANHLPAYAGAHPVEVTFRWRERQTDYSLLERSHTQRVEQLPARYTIHVGGADHPVVDSLTVNLSGAVPGARYGYSDGRDAGGERFVPRWLTVGTNLAQGKPYTVSVPSNDRWGAGDPDGRKLTDGVVGPPFAGGGNPTHGLCWDKGTKPVVTVDLGRVQRCGAFRINLGGGWPWWDALKGEVEDRVSVLTSTDGVEFGNLGNIGTDLRWKDLPANHMWPDNEELTAHLFELVPPNPVDARYVRFDIAPQRSLCVNEVQVLDSLGYEPFDLRVALPDERTPGSGETPKVLTPAGRPVPAPLAARNASRPLGHPVLEPPTLHSLGCYWLVAGDENGNAEVNVEYRRQGAGAWRRSLPLFRVEKDAHRDENGGSDVPVPDDARLFAGSVLFLDPDTAHEVRLRLADPDGGDCERILQARTAGEPVAPVGLRPRHVVPGEGGGTGAEADPFRGLAAAEAVAEAGDLFLVHAGEYRGTFTVSGGGEPGRPIVWRGAGDGEAVLRGHAQDGGRAERVISASGVRDVWFEDLTVGNGNYGLVLHDSARVVVRRCRIRDVDYGITCTRNTDGVATGLFVADNTITGPCTWPRSKGIENARGVQVTGTGQVVCYNRISGFADGIDTFPSGQCSAIDFHNNDISTMTDDGIEMDYSRRNTRCFLNRLTDTFTGVSVQPVFGGPVYIVRNAMFNLVYTPFKMHNSPSGALMLHNTAVKAGSPLSIMAHEPVRNCLFRNNLFVGTEDRYGFESTAPMVDCDFDYDGFSGGPWRLFLKWNGERYASLDEARRKAPVYRHAVTVGSALLFASTPPTPSDAAIQTKTTPDLRPHEAGGAVDGGEPLPGVNDGFAGRAPDLGAYEAGTGLPWYGPRPRK